MRASNSGGDMSNKGAAGSAVLVLMGLACRGQSSKYIRGLLCQGLKHILFLRCMSLRLNQTAQG